MCLVVLVQPNRSGRTLRLHLFIFQTITRATESRKAEEVPPQHLRKLDGPPTESSDRAGLQRKKLPRSLRRLDSSVVVLESIFPTCRLAGHRQSCYEQDSFIWWLVVVRWLSIVARVTSSVFFLSLFSTPRLPSRFFLRWFSYRTLYTGRYFLSSFF